MEVVNVNLSKNKNIKQEILKLEQVSFQYEESQKALVQIDVTFYAGEKVAVLGNNGAGKSTLFLVCNGVQQPTNGRIYLNEQEMGSGKKDQLALRQSIGLVFQDVDVQIIGSTVYEEISFGPMNLQLSKDEVRERVEGVIQNFDLGGFEERVPHRLSGGEKKRVCIADVLAMKPKIIFFDEPTTGLDPKNTLLFEENLKTLEKQGMGTVIATHDVDFAWRFAERIILFHEGKIVGDGDPDELFRDKELMKLCGLVQPMLLHIGEKLGWTKIPRRVEELDV